MAPQMTKALKASYARAPGVMGEISMPGKILSTIMQKAKILQEAEYGLEIHEAYGGRFSGLGKRFDGKRRVTEERRKEINEFPSAE